MSLNIFCFSLMTWVTQRSVTHYILWDKDAFIRVLLLRGMIFRLWPMIERQGGFLLLIMVLMSLSYCHCYLFDVLYEPLFLFLTYMDLLKYQHLNSVMNIILWISSLLWVCDSSILPTNAIIPYRTLLKDIYL
jgi:hypothetical protein